jgi:hypothetical protein
MGRADGAQSAILKDLTAFDRLNADTMPPRRPVLDLAARKMLPETNKKNNNAGKLLNSNN